MPDTRYTCLNTATLPSPCPSLSSNNHPETWKLIQEEAESKHMEGLAGYTTLKQEVLQATAGVIGCGTVGLSVLSGRDPALAFLAGGLAGIAYQRLLQLSVDAVPGGPKASALQQVAHFVGVCSCPSHGHLLGPKLRHKQLSLRFNTSTPSVYKAQAEPRQLLSRPASSTCTRCYTCSPACCHLACCMHSWHTAVIS